MTGAVRIGQMENEKYGLSGEEWEKLEKKFGAELTLSLIKVLSTPFRRRQLSTRSSRQTNFPVVLESEMGKSSVVVPLDASEFSLLAGAGKRYEDEHEMKGRGIVRSVRN